MSPAAGTTIYTAGRLVADPETVIAPGAVSVSDGKVSAVGRPDDLLRRAPAGSPRVDLPGLLLLPGLVNAHTHLSIPSIGDPGSLPGSGDPSFVDWLLRILVWRRFAQREEFSRNVADAAAEALSCGTTAVGEIAGPEIGAYAALPLRGRIFAEGIGFFPEVAEEMTASVEEALVRIAGLADATGGRLAPGVSPHTLYTVGEPLLRRLADLAESRHLPVALHLAESPVETEFLSAGRGEIADRLYPAVGKDVSWFRGLGMSIPEYLRRAGLLREGLLLVHAVHLSQEEIGALAEGGARFVLCPRSNAAHGNGSPDVTGFVDGGIPFALGTDSLASVPSLSLWEEMRAAAGLYRGSRSGSALWKEIFRAATEQGARAVALPGGRLAPGGPADLVAVDDPGGPDDSLFARLGERTGAEQVRLTVISGERMHERP
ncbi:MAG: amidohydrolase family protein [Deltaproteobacteria bacterium]